MAKKQTNDVTTTSEPEAFSLTPEEQEAILALRQKRAANPALAEQVGVKELAQALVIAIESTRPPQKKNPFNRKKGNPWLNKDGTPKPKLKRAWYQHGGEINPDHLYSEEIELLNQVKPGYYVGGLVIVTKRKDRGYNITWPVRTAAQRLRVMNEAGGSFSEILRRCIEEYNNPAKYKGPDDDDE